MPNGFSVPAHYVDFVTQRHTRVTLPYTGTLATLAGVETLTNKTLTSPSITGGTFSTPSLTSPTITNPTITGVTPVDVSTSTVTIDATTHAGRIITLSRAAGIAATLPAATGTGNRYTFVVLVTFTGDATIKVASSTDYMIGTALLFQDGGDTTVGFATANSGTVATETDTVDLFDTGNTTGGFKGCIVELTDIASAVWLVRMVSDAAGTEATPFKVTV